MVWTPIIQGMGIMSFIFLISSINIKDKKLNGLKSLLFLLSIVDAILISFINYIITLHPTTLTESKPLFLGFLVTHGLILIAIIWFYAFYLIHRGLKDGRK